MSLLLTLIGLGRGTMRPEIREGLEAEGLVLLEERLGGSVRYHRFAAPGKRFHGKVVPVHVALGISSERLAVYAQSGRVKLIDSPFDSSRFDALEVSLHGAGAVAFRIDFDHHAEAEDVSGQVTIRVRTPSAARVVEEVQRLLGRDGP